MVYNRRKRMFRLAVLVIGAWVLRGQTSQSPQDLLKQAIASHQAGKLDDAIRDYRAFLDMYPGVVQVRSNLGAALAAQGQYQEAIFEYKRALRIAPDAQVSLNLARAYYKAAQFPAAIEQLEIVRKSMAADLQAVQLLADCYLRTGEYKKVIELLEPQRRANPNDAAIAYMLGTALVRDGQSGEGQSIINQILKYGDSAEARLLIGTTKLGVNEFAGARADLQRAVELNPTLPDAHAYYGLSLLGTGDQEGARKAFQQELEINPNNFDANLRLGFMLRQDQDYKAALPYLARALDVRPGDFGVRFQIALVGLELGQVEKAQTELESLVKDAPNFTEAHVTLATVYYRQKRKPEGDRERAIAERLRAAEQAAEPAQKAAQ
jgi:tetratricopeptide (TPR) repeat protein